MATTFARSPADAEAMLLKRYGNNAKGVCGLNWKNSGSGHAFAWIIENGKVTWLDFQNGKLGDDVKEYWKKATTNAPLQLYRIDDKLDEIDFEKLQKCSDLH